MKRSVFLIILIALASCKAQQVSNSQQLSNSQQASIKNTEWKLVKLDKEDVSTLNPPITLLLDEAQPKVNGFAGCNQFFGKYELGESNLKFIGLGSTKMYCQDKSAVEDKYFKALSEVQSFKTEGSKLLLLTGEKIVLEFKK